MDYGKITTTSTIENMPMRYTASWDLREDETSKAFVANHDGWLEKVYTAQPSYDPETEYITEKWVEQSGKAVQVWEKHEIPTPEPTLEDRVDNLEENVSDIINGVT